MRRSETGWLFQVRPKEVWHISKQTLSSPVLHERSAHPCAVGDHAAVIRLRGWSHVKLDFPIAMELRTSSSSVVQMAKILIATHTVQLTSSEAEVEMDMSAVSVTVLLAPSMPDTHVSTLV
jgi:hypothetical protein